MDYFDDFREAIACRQPKQAVPVWEIEFQAWDAMSDRHVILAEEFEQLSPKEQDYTLRENAEIILSVCEELHFAALSVPTFYWDQAPGQLAYYVLPEDFPYRQFEILQKMMDDKLLLVANTWGGVLGAIYDSEFCAKLFEAPEEIDKLARETYERGITIAKRYKDLGAHAMLCSADLADNHGPFYNPTQMRRFILPYLHCWADEVANMGMYSILHSDGDLTPCLDEIADTALHALQSIDPVAGMDMSTAKASVKGRLCLCGNIDCGLLLHGTPQAVFDATRVLLDDCKAKGGLILGAANAIQPEVPAENYRAMIQAWEKYGQYSKDSEYQSLVDRKAVI